MITDEKISFANLSIKPDRVAVDAFFNGGVHELWFEFDRKITPSADAVALALSTLCGTKYRELEFGFTISENIAEGIADFCKAEVLGRRTGHYSRSSCGGPVLSFSGGFDSLAALRLLRNQTNLVSIDFGGWFKREAKFFRQFDSVVVTTNVRRPPTQRDSLARNHWSFMALGAILTAEHFDAAYHVFGSILGDKFSRRPNLRPLPPFRMLGLENLPVTDGITELGTAKVLLQTDPELIGDSIESLAGSTDRKHYLKIAIAQAMRDEMGIQIDLPELPTEWDKKIPFESSYTTAMTALYLISRGNYDLIAPIFESVPNDALEIGESLSMNFITKANWDFYSGAPKHHLAALSPRLIELGFEPYSEFDWQEARQVRDYLNRIFGKS